MSFSDIIKEASSKDWSLELFTKRVIILGCGNVLFGDDGFGPQVIDHLLTNYDLPPDVYALDVGTSVRNILFDFILSPQKPQKVILIDAIQVEGKRPGEIFEIDIDKVPVEKIPSFSVHEGPTLNFLQELKNFGQMRIHVVVAQAKEIPEIVKPGLSSEVQVAIPKACEYLKRFWQKT